jgi:hypothetical protein
MSSDRVRCSLWHTRSSSESISGGDLSRRGSMYTPQLSRELRSLGSVRISMVRFFERHKFCNPRTCDSPCLIALLVQEDAKPGLLPCPTVNNNTSATRVGCSAPPAKPGTRLNPHDLGRIAHPGRQVHCLTVNRRRRVTTNRLESDGLVLDIRIPVPCLGTPWTSASGSRPRVWPKRRPEI